MNEDLFRKELIKEIRKLNDNLKSIEEILMYHTGLITEDQYRES